MENFKPQNIEKNNESTLNQRRSLLKKLRNTIVAGLGLVTMVNNAEGQTKKDTSELTKDNYFWVTKNPANPELLKYNDSLEAYNIGQNNLKKAFEDYNKLSKKDTFPTESLPDTFFVEENKPFTQLHNHKDTPGKENLFDTDYENHKLNNIRPERALHLDAFVKDPKDKDEEIRLSKIYPIYPKPKKEIKYLPPLGTINVHGKSFNYYSLEKLSDIKDKLFSHGINLTKVGETSNYAVTRFQEKTKGWQGNKLLDETGAVLIDLDTL